MKKYNLPKNNSVVDTVILANGQFPESEIALSVLNNARFIVCCDGAINQLSKTNLVPSAIVGDCDSLSDENKHKYNDILQRNPDQETNDLTKAVEFCIKNNRTRLTILGATGKREDHTLGNISLLVEYLDRCDVEMITDYGLFVAIKKNAEFESYKGQQVSMFAIEKANISVHNLMYEVKHRQFTNWWQGTLNESLSDKFAIETDAAIIVYRSF